MVKESGGNSALNESFDHQTQQQMHMIEQLEAELEALSYKEEAIMKQYLSMSSDCESYRTITKFIPNVAKQEDKLLRNDVSPNVCVSVSDGSLINDLSSVTLMQWSAASACILADLVNNTHEDLVNLVADYMSYTSKIGVLATIYTWESVLRYDDIYREKQSKCGFRWGSDLPHLAAVSLVPLRSSDDTPEGNTDTADHRRNNRFLPPCKFWNEKEACARPTCRFPHKCAWCGSVVHPRSGHDEAVQAAEYCGMKHCNGYPRAVDLAINANE